MSVEISVILIMGFIIIYAILIQVYTVLFRITGLTKEKAKFQVTSLLTNSGFTTTESEIIAEDKTRRKIARAAMITGYSFSVLIVSLVINLLLKLRDDVQTNTLYVIGIAFAIFLVSFIFLKIPFVSKFLEKIIETIGGKIISKGRVDNLVTPLDVYGKDAIVEVFIHHLPEFMVDKTLNDCKLKDLYGMNVLMIKRSNDVISVTKDTIIEKNDIIIVFGPYKKIKEIFIKK